MFLQVHEPPSILFKVLRERGVFRAAAGDGAIEAPDRGILGRAIASGESATSRLKLVPFSDPKLTGDWLSELVLILELRKI